MKMILAIMPTNTSEIVSTALLEAEYRVTKFASTAGFLSGGTTTIMAVANDDKVDNALDIIRNLIPESEPADSARGRVTIYVLPVKDFERV